MRQKQIVTSVVVNLLLILAAKFTSAKMIMEQQDDIVKPSSYVSISADCVTIEDPRANENSCGALACATKAFAQSVPAFHNRTSDAVDNLNKCLSTGKSALIVGHGSPGKIKTGGEPGSSTDQVVSFHNDSEIAWGPSFDHLKGKNISQLTFLGCYTGYTGQNGQNGAGAILLNKLYSHITMVNESTTKTRAPTGDVFCENSKFYFEDGADWQEAPIPPTSIASQPKPRSVTTNQFLKLRDLHKTVGDSWVIIFPNQILDVEPSFIDSNLHPEISSDPRGSDKINVLDNIDFQQPLISSACPIAGAIGKIKLRFKTGIGPRTFEVLSDGLLRDLSQLDVNVFYRGSSELMNQFDETSVRMNELRRK